MIKHFSPRVCGGGLRLRICAIQTSCLCLKSCGALIPVHLRKFVLTTTIPKNHAAASFDSFARSSEEKIFAAQDPQTLSSQPKACRPEVI